MASPWLTPFHWPGRDRRFLSGLPPGELRRYNLLWLGRPSSAAWLVGTIALLTVAAVAYATDRPWAAAGLVGVLVPYGLLFHHRESRLRRSLVERDHPTLCRQCGYDCRATPGGPCPECGASPTVSA